MTLLNASQQAYLARMRKKLWTRAFLIEITDVPRVGDSYYASPGETTVVVASGDWVWRDQVEATHGGPGGVPIDADVILNTDIIYSGSVIHSGARLRIDGTLCAITRAAPFLESGELEIYGVKVS